MKKILAMALALLMVAVLLPVTAMAAEVNVSTYEELKNALQNEGAYVKLTDSIDTTATLGAGVADVVGAADNCTIDLNGMTFKANNFAVIFQGKNLTIKNGKFDANGGSYGLFVGDEGVTQNVLIEDITIAGGINVYNASDVLLRNVNITGTNYYAVWCDEAGQVTIESGNFQSNGYAVLGLTTNDSKLDVSGGIFNANSKPLVLTNGNNFGTPTLTGGSYDTNPLTYTEPAAVVITDSNMQYHIGKAAKEAMQQGGTFTVVQGNTLQSVPEGVVLKNETGEEITVNGTKVPAGDEITAKKASIVVIIPDDTTDTTTTTETTNNPATGMNDFVSAAIAVAAVSLLGMAAVLRKK